MKPADGALCKQFADSPFISENPPVLRLTLIVFSLAWASLPWSDAMAQKATREAFLLLPEPKAMRTSISLPLRGAARTVWTPARQTQWLPGVKTYSTDEFAKLGFSSDTFVERARAAADKRLAKLQPEFVRDEEGAIAYAVFRDDSGLMATLLAAPSLGRIFGRIFGDKVWVVLPDRFALYVFPPNEEALSGFTGDLRRLYNRATYAASPEVFEVTKEQEAPRVIGSLGS